MIPVQGDDDSEGHHDDGSNQLDQGLTGHQVLAFDWSGKGRFGVVRFPRRPSIRRPPGLCNTVVNRPPLPRMAWTIALRHRLGIGMEVDAAGMAVAPLIRDDLDVVTDRPASVPAR